MTSPRHVAEHHTCFRCRVLAGILVVIALEVGILRDTGRTAKSGDRKNRNGNRNMPVYEVVEWGGLR